MAKMLKVVTEQNGFNLHGLDRVSVSSVNTFRNAPSKWAVRYLYGENFPAGWPAMRGKAVEAGVDAGLYEGIATEDCVEVAIERLKAEGMMMPNKQDELNTHIPFTTRMVETALEQLEFLGKPDVPPEGARQWQINVPIRFKEGEAGVIGNLGYLDYKWTVTDELRKRAAKKMDLSNVDVLVVDLKTTAKAPSKWSVDHAIQAAVYEQSVLLEDACIGVKRQRVQVKFLYCLTRQKDPFLWLTMNDSEEYIKVLCRTIRTMDSLLSLATDKDKILAVLPHNPDTFYWSDAEHIDQKYFR